MKVKEYEIEYLRFSDGTSPFKKWFFALKDYRAKTIGLARIARLKEGNFGDYKSVGDGV